MRARQRAKQRPRRAAHARWNFRWKFLAAEREPRSLTPSTWPAVEDALKRWIGGPPFDNLRLWRRSEMRWQP